MRKLVAAAICLLSLSLSATTGRRCLKEARTRTGKRVVNSSSGGSIKRCRELEIMYTGGVVDLSKPQKFDTCRGQTLFLPIIVGTR